jgi:hypothetical protein
VYKTKLGNHTAKNLLAFLAEAANADGNCWPSLQRIANHTEIGTRTIQRMFQVFSEIGLVTKVRCGPHNSPGFQLNLQKVGTDLRKDFGVAYAAAQSHAAPDEAKACRDDNSDDVAPTQSDVVTTTRGVMPTQSGVVATNPPHPLIGRTVIEPKWNTQGNESARRARTAPLNCSRPVPANQDDGAAMNAAIRLFEMLCVPRDVGTLDLAAQAIRAQAKEWGGIEQTAERILVVANEAKAAGERHWRFWFADGGYLGKSTPKAPDKREAALLAFHAERQKMRGEKYDR